MSFNDLLPEIMAEIFELCQDSWLDSDLRLESQETSDKMRVCKLWRDVMVSQPVLWSTIVVHVDDSRRDFALQMELTKIWLKRSQDAPLYIGVLPVLSSTLLAQQTLHYGQILDVMLTELPRWRNAMLPMPSKIRDLKNVIPLEGAPILQWLVVNFWELGRQTIMEGAHDKLHLERLMASPNLRYFSPPSFGLMKVTIDRLPWSLTRLVSMKIDFGLTSELLRILPLSPTLRDLTCVKIKSIPREVSHPIPHVVHDNLQSLEVSGRSEVMIDHLTLPSLLDLDYTNDNGDCSPTESGLKVVAFLERSKCSLWKFSYQESQGSDVNCLIECLRKTPKDMISIWLGSFNSNDGCDALFTALTIEAIGHSGSLRPDELESQVLCPRLKRVLTFSNRSPSKFILEKLVVSRKMALPDQNPLEVYHNNQLQVFEDSSMSRQEALARYWN